MPNVWDTLRIAASQPAPPVNYDTRPTPSYAMRSIFPQAAAAFAPLGAAVASAAMPPVTPAMRLANTPAVLPAANRNAVVPPAVLPGAAGTALWRSPMQIVNELGYGIPEVPMVNGKPAYRLDTARSTAEMQNIVNNYYGRPAAAGGGGGGAGEGGYNTRLWAPPPGNVEAYYPGWWDAFAREHEYTTKDGRTYNLTPDQVYDRDGENAVNHALFDKAWGDKFADLYKRPPTEDDWKASYAERQYKYYNGYGL